MSLSDGHKLKNFAVQQFQAAVLFSQHAHLAHAMEDLDGKTERLGRPRLFPERRQIFSDSLHHGQTYGMAADSAIPFPLNPTSAPLPPALEWLYSTQLYGIKLGLDNVHKLLEALGSPQAGVKFIHVAGTNGKGSTCAFMHAILKEAGIKAGLFTSPHLIRFNERIRDTERQITNEEIESGLTQIRDLIAEWNPHPTFFEISLALALVWFQRRGVEWVILETGLGGRLDATNAILPEVSVITRIGMDHMDQLGDSLAKIAAEKAGIIKPGVPVVTVPQPAEAQAVIEKVAKQNKTTVLQADAPVTEVTLGLAGVHQGWNASLAIDALREAGLRIPAVTFQAGLAAVDWPARFQKLDEGRLILDGAHNADAAQALAKAWRAEFPGEKPTIVFGGSTGKDLAEVMRPLVHLAERWVLTRFDSPRSVPLESLQAALNVVDETTERHETPDLARALGIARSMPQRILVFGSLFLAGEFLASQPDAAAALQPSAQ